MSARVFDFTPPLKVYRQHYCERNHRNYRTFAQCAFSGADWVEAFDAGDELPYALVTYCRKNYRFGDQRKVSLWTSRENAEICKEGIDRSGCGGGCSRHHEIIRLEWTHEKSPCRVTRAFSENHTSETETH
ncbi:hypothetical protein [Streptomyces erythrochromogenes]|uniref:hypothetical protein n=1 Tax=Streptomyces erythrochromogenes TaxID=285574 RepID=UPI0036764C3A